MPFRFADDIGLEHEYYQKIKIVMPTNGRLIKFLGQVKKWSLQYLKEDDLIEWDVEKTNPEGSHDTAILWFDSPKIFTLFLLSKDTLMNDE